MRDISIAIIGSGFAGLGMAIQLKQRGIHSFTVFESASAVGGTWRDNTYPGCACDVPSHVYSYSFERNPDWTRNFSPQEEILEYIRRCSTKYGVDPHIRFNTRIVRAQYDEEEARWELTSADGERFCAQVLVAGTGPLRIPNIPDLPGMDSFEGPAMHTARWDHDFDYAGKRVAVVGTGASAIQVVPELARSVDKLHLFQRTPPWISPKLDGPIPEEWRARFRRHPSLTFLYRNLFYWLSELLGTGFFVDRRMMDWRENMLRKHLEESIDDPALRELLTPDYGLGCKRILFTNDYLPALNRDNVEVIGSGVAEITRDRVIASDGTAREVDAIVYATGFRVTDFLAPLQVVGKGGLDLNDAWSDGAEAYYGINVAHFPNLHILVGPNTGLGHNSIVFMIEAQVHYVLECLERMRTEDLASLDVLPAAQREFNDKIQERLLNGVWNTGGCMSWYLDENGKNVTLWPGYTFEYWLRTRRVKWEHFREEPRLRHHRAADEEGASAQVSA